MDWKELGGKIATAAPLLGGLIAGPAGAGVGQVVNLVAGALGLTPDQATPAAIAHQLQTDPEALLKLRELEQAHHEELARLALEQARMELADRADARAREIAITRTTGRRDYQLYVLAWLVVVGFGGLCAILMRYPVPEGSSQVVYMLFGSLASGFTLVLQYFFGSSRSSQDKTRLLTRNRDNETSN
jgi:hypothetical protein